MPKRHRVRPGDSLDRLAFEYGFAVSTIWDHPENAGLRERRENPNMLCAEDEVFIPDITPKWHTVATGGRYKFRRKGVPARFRLRLTEDFLPRAGIPYRLVLPDREIAGTTDEAGWIEIYVPNALEEADLYAGDDPPVTLLFGHLEPADTIRGIQQRLNSLGFECGDEDGELNEETREALRAFQQHWSLPASGEPDHVTIRRLGEIHD